MKMRDGKKTNRKLRGGGRLGNLFGGWLVVGLCLLGMVESGWAQVVVKNAAGGTVASGADFSAVKDSLNGNTAVVGTDFTQSDTVTFDGNVAFSIESDTWIQRTISGSAAGGVFSQTSSGKSLTLDLSSVKFSTGRGYYIRGDASYGGAIYSAGTLSLTADVVTFGGGDEEGNEADYGGAIAALGDITVSGLLSFNRNTAYLGGAVYTRGVANISRAFFTNNSALVQGGAIMISSQGTSTLSTVQFNSNRANEGGAIYTLGNLQFTGGNTFTTNLAKGQGGAINAANVTFSGEDTTAQFVGNRQGVTINDDGEVTDWGTANDIYATGSVTFRDGGEYTLNGGIIAQSLVIGVSDQSGVPVVTLRKGSKTDVTNFSMVGTGSMLNVVLNKHNLVESVGDTTFAADATQLNVSGTVNFGTGSLLQYQLDSSMASNGIYLGATGDFSKVAASSVITQLIGNDSKGKFIVSTKNEEGIWLSLSESERKVIRSDAQGVFQMQHDTFNGAFLTGEGSLDPATGDQIVLTDNANATAMVNLSGVSSLSIFSNVADTQRTITMDSTVAAGSGAFLKFENAVTLALKDVQFVGGKGVGAGVSFGGAIYSSGGMTFTGQAVLGGTGANERNTARFGGAVGNYKGDVVFDGTFAFYNNYASHSGGAVQSAGNLIFKSTGNYIFKGNMANAYGGAIAGGGNTYLSGTARFEDNLAFYGGAIHSSNTVYFTGKGSDMKFTGNKQGVTIIDGTPKEGTGQVNDVRASNVTIQDGGTYSFGGGLQVDNVLTIGVVGQDGAPVVTLGSGSITQVKDFALTGKETTLEIVLNEKNLVQSLTDTTFQTGATQFSVSGSTSGSTDATLRYLLGNVGKEDIYLGAKGNFTNFNSAIVGQITGTVPERMYLVTKKDDKGIWLSLTEAKGKVIREKNGMTIYSSDTFDEVFNPNFGVTTTGEKIILLDSVAAEKMVSLSGVTALTIQSNMDDVVRKITMDSNVAAGSGAFLAFDSGVTLTLEDVQFVGGKGGTASNNAVTGGAFYSNGDLTLTGSAIFGEVKDENINEGNTARNGGALWAYNIILNGKFDFLNNSAGLYGGAIYANSDVTFSGGTNTFTKNSASGNGGAIYADNTVTLSGGTNIFTENKAVHGGAIFAQKDVDLSGNNTFAKNSATEFGGAIEAHLGNVTLSDTNIFTENSANWHGGAIFAYFGNVTLSGNNTFTKNSANENGGAILAYDGNVTLSGNNTFKDNLAGEYGGAIYGWSYNVTLSGNGSEATFSGNKHGVTFDSDGKPVAGTGTNNDILSYEGNVTIRDGGTYFFGGGIVATRYTGTGGTLQIGVDGQDGAPDVTFGGGSITDVIDFSLAEEGSTLEVVLNEKNKVDSWTNTTFNDGATVFQVSGTATGDVGTTLRYVLEDVAEDEIYLGATGDFSGFNSTIIAQITGNQPDGTFIAKKKNNEGIWLGVMNANGAVVRMDTNGAIYESDTFDEVFNPDITPPPATGDNIVLTQNVTAEKMVSLTGVTALNIYSNTAGTVRTITMDSNVAVGQGAFLAFDGETKLTLTDMRFVGGKGATNAISEPFGGAFYSQGKMEVQATNVTFEDNFAEIGGAIGSDGDLTFTGENTLLTKNVAKQNGGAIGARGTVTMSGSGRLTQNSASWYGGAISGNEVNISGRYEITNNSAGNPNATSAAGGAISASNGVTFSGSETEIVFRNNTVTDKNGTVANDVDSLFGPVTIRDGGTYYFGGGIVSPTLNIGTDNQDGTPNVTFGANSISKVSDALNLQNTTLTFELDKNSGGKTYLDASNANTIAIDTNSTEILLALDNAATINGANGAVLIAGNGTDLSALESSVSSILYDIQKKFENNNLVVKSHANDIRDVVQDVGGNAGVVLEMGRTDTEKEKLAYELLDEQTVSDAQRNVSDFTMEAFASNATAQVQRISYMNQMMAQKLTSGSWTRDFESCYDPGDCCCLPGAMLWASAYGLGGVTRQYDGFARHDYDQWGTMIGADWQDDTTRFGLYYAYGQSEFAGAATAMESDDHTFGAYLRWDSFVAGGYSLLGGNYSFSNYETTYRSAFDPSKAFHGDLDGSQGSLYFEKGWEWDNSTGGRLNPYVALQYIGFQSDGFSLTETTLSDTEMDSLRSVLGLRWSRMFHLEAASVNLNLGIAWHHEFADTEGTFLLSVGNYNPVVIRGNGGGRDWCEFTLGTGLALTDRLTLSADYYLFVNAPTSVHAGMGTLTWKF